jgi:hypothetical protein
MAFLKKIKSIDLIGLSVLFCFLIAYFGIAYFNRAMQDDFGNYHLTQSLGVIGTGVYSYNHIEGAFIWYLWPSLNAFINQCNTHVFLINLINLIMVFTSLFLMLTQIIKKLLPFYSAWIPLNLCILTITALFYFRNDIVNQAVFWLSGSGYLSLMSFLFLGIYFLLKGGTVNFTISLLLLFLFATARIHYTLATLGILFYFLLWYFSENRKINTQVLFLIIAVLLGLAIYLLAPGNYVGRLNTVPVKHLETPLTEYVKQFILSLACYFFMHFLRSLPLLILNFSLAFIGGLKDEKNTFSKNAFMAFVKFSVFAVLISWFALALVMTVIFLKHGNTRTFLFPLFITAMLMNINFYFLGIRFKQKFQSFSRLALPIGLIACGFFLYFFFFDFGNLKKFSAQFDQRTESIIRAKKHLTSKDTLFLTLLPYTKTLMSNEQRGEPYPQWQADYLEKYYEPSFKIKLVLPDIKDKAETEKTY